MSVSNHQLTRFRSGSLAEMAAIAFPLMLTTLSTNMMIFVDRLVLARYSIDAMNAGVMGFLAAAIFIYPIVSVASSADVLVGRFNGAGDSKRIAQPVWQMLWFCLMLWPLLLAIAFWGGDILLAKDFEYSAGLYFRPMMSAAMLAGLIASVSAFYIGRGKTRLIFLATVLGHLTNAVLDVVWVFGYLGFPEMGVSGAAYATIVGQLITFVLLFGVFLLPHNAHSFGSWSMRLRLPIFKECLRLGLPGAIGHMVEISAWVTVNALLARVGIVPLTLLLLGQNLFVLMGFVTDALHKAAMAVSSNYVGARDWGAFRTSLWAGIRLNCLIACVLGVVLFVYSEAVCDLFLAAGEVEFVEGLAGLASGVFIWVALAAGVDGVAWVFAAFLLSLGDSKFLLWCNAALAWTVCVLPVYVFIVRWGADSSWVWPLVCVYMFSIAASFGWRLWNRYRVRETLPLDAV